MAALSGRHGIGFEKDLAYTKGLDPKEDLAYTKKGSDQPAFVAGRVALVSQIG